MVNESNIVPDFVSLLFWLTPSGPGADTAGKNAAASIKTVAASLIDQMNACCRVPVLTRIPTPSDAVGMCSRIWLSGTPRIRHKTDYPVESISRASTPSPRLAGKRGRI